MSKQQKNKNSVSVADESIKVDEPAINPSDNSQELEDEKEKTDSQNESKISPAPEKKTGKKEINGTFRFKKFNK